MAVEMLLFAHMGLTMAAGRFVGAVMLAYLALGSMLPDMIDKPLGLIAFGTPAMGRIYAHTLLFLMVLVALAAYFRDMRLASLTGGVLAHFMLDFIWKSPAIFLWPLLGGFPIANLATMNYLHSLLIGLHDPMVLVPELLGLLYLIYFFFEQSSNISARFRTMAANNRSITALVQVLFKNSGETGLPKSDNS